MKQSCLFLLHELTIVVLICSLKLECEKLASEKTEMQRHYIMVSSAGLAQLNPVCEEVKYGVGLQLEHVFHGAESTQEEM